jgi:hypothetical protein
LKPHVNSRPTLVAVDAIATVVVLAVWREDAMEDNNEGFLARAKGRK